MAASKVSNRLYQSAAQRWAGIGPYYAMFPSDFADKVVEKYTESGDVVLDPFAGRGTAVFSAAAKGRTGIGIEINPVGWVYSQAKIRPASQKAVTRRFIELESSAPNYQQLANSLPPFFHGCFSKQVQSYLLAARSELNWRRASTDWTAMALLLVYLHGKRGTALSNQLHQAKSMAPDYALRWWQARNLPPPEIEPASFMVKRLEWRYAKGIPPKTPSRVLLGDNTHWLPRLIEDVRRSKMCRPKLLFTSPPYFGLTNYHYDQWLRLWLLGGTPAPGRQTQKGVHKNRFENLENYRNLLTSTFGRTAEVLARNAVVYVRTGKRVPTLEITIAALEYAFPRKKLQVIDRPFLRPTQTRLFGDKTLKEGEVDVILS